MEPGAGIDRTSSDHWPSRRPPLASDHPEADMTDLPASPTAPSPSASTADPAPPPSPPMRIHVSIVIALLVLTALIQVYAFRYVASRAATWLQDPAPVAPQHYPGASDPEGAQQQGRLLAQFALAKERERMHLQLAVHYLQNYYMAIVVSMAMGAIAAIALFAITSRSEEDPS